VPPRTQEPPRPPGSRAIELASIVACLSLLTYLGVGIGAAFAGARASVSWALAALVAAYLVADLVSGVVHFVADTYFEIDTPLVGRKFVLPFRAHHACPEAMVAHDFVEANGDSCLVVLFALVPTALFVPVAAGGAATTWGSFVVAFSMLIVLTNEAHRYAHAETAPRAVRLLQRLRLILPPEEHARHHQAPFDRAYCITSGVLNPLLDRLGLFRAIARVIPPGDACTRADESQRGANADMRRRDPARDAAND
jgi:plasmanylethanolamine desaturase